MKNEEKSRHKGLAVFRQDHAMRCALLEIGFLTNASERKVMLLRDTRIMLARGFWTKATGHGPTRQVIVSKVERK